jgi:circadian clock protein KaiC
MTVKGPTGAERQESSLKKAPIGVEGLDAITHGGFPAGRPTLICGGPGCGKTILAMEFLVRGALEFDEPGLFVSFEESIEDLYHNFRSFGFDLESLVEQKKLFISHVKLSRTEIVESGEFTLDGLFIRLADGIQQVGAKRVAIDTLESLFSHLTDTNALRAEIARLFGWLKDQGMTSVITAEKGSGQLTRNGLEEYVSDCVLTLDHRIADQISKRRLRVVKYRGSSHEKDEYPFLIGASGFSALPITSVHLDHTVSSDRVSTGVPDLDAMLGGKGYYRGSTVLLSGAAGSGKSTLAASFAAATCARGERCLLLAFEESTGQMIRNMRSVGLDLEPWVEQGLLHIQASRPTLFGLEEHLVSIVELGRRVAPSAVVVDPITNFLSSGSAWEVKALLTRVLDQFRALGATVLATSLTSGSGTVEATGTGLSSIMDTWVALDQRRKGNTRRCCLYVLKSRGMEHSHEVRELVMSSAGLSLSAITDGDDKTQPAGSAGGKP